MTRPRDPDEIIGRYFQDGPAELSPRLLASIRDDVHATRQRASRRPWRTIAMPRPILLFAVLGALLLAVGAFALGVPGGRPAPSAAPTSGLPAKATVAATTPSPSPAVVAYPLVDGEPWIMLGADDGGLTLVRPDGTDAHGILGDLPVNVSLPADWSRDGRRITFEGNGDRGSQVWMANADGTGARQLTPTPVGCPEGACTEGVRPAWSPDGRTIAFIAPAHVAGTFTKTALVLLDVATGSTTELYSTADVGLTRPSWSPDGTRIAVEIDRYAGVPEQTRLTSTAIGIVDVAGSDHTPREITEPSLLAGFPSWHPTQDLIVFRTNPYDGNTKTLQDSAAPSDLYTVRPDGTGLHKVTDNVVRGDVVRAPSWTPDGRILYSTFPSPGAPETLRVIATDGTGDASATGTVTTLGEGRWRPGT